MATGLGGYVKARRTELGMTQEALADRAGLNQPVVSDIERGRTALSSADIRRRLAAALGVRHLDLLVAAGELTEGEANAGPPAALSPAERRVLDALRGIDLSRRTVDYVIRVLDGIREWQAPPADPTARPTATGSAGRARRNR